MVREGLRNLAAGANPMGLKRGIESAVAAVVSFIEDSSHDVQMIEGGVASVAAISAADSEIGTTIAEAFESVGKDGVITVEEGQTFGLELEFTEGMQFDKGYISPYFVTDPDTQEAVLDDPYILIANQKISSVNDMLPVLEKIMQTGKPVMVLSEDVEGEALATLVVNKIRGTFPSLAVKAPGFGERRKAMLQDIATLTGGTVISEEVGLKLDGVALDMLGRARKVIVDKDNTTVIDGAGAAADVKARIRQIEREIDNTDSDWDREKLQERLAKLSGGVSVIKVGAATEVELKEKKHRIEDAVSATRASVEEGIVAGGGVSLLRAQSAIDELDAGTQRRAGRPLHRPACSRGTHPTDRIQRRIRGRCGSRPCTQRRRRFRLQRRNRRIRGPAQHRHTRPRQSDPLGSAKRRVDRRVAAHHRSAGRRTPERLACTGRRRSWTRRRCPTRNGLLTPQTTTSTSTSGPPKRRAAPRDPPTRPSPTAADTQTHAHGPPTPTFGEPGDGSPRNITPNTNNSTPDPTFSAQALLGTPRAEAGVGVIPEGDAPQRRPPAISLGVNGIFGRDGAIFRVLV